MFGIIKCTFYGFVAFMLLMVIFGIKDYQRPARDVEELLGFDSKDVYEQIDDSHKPNPDSTLSRLCNRH